VFFFVSDFFATTNLIFFGQNFELIVTVYDTLIYLIFREFQVTKTFWWFCLIIQNNEACDFDTWVPSSELLNKNGTIHIGVQVADF
jgi:hypothetical protein